MQEFKILILTNHSGHSTENSLYSLALGMQKHASCERVDIASEGNEENDVFFGKHDPKEIFVTSVDEKFEFRNGENFQKEKLVKVLVERYDVIWLRMPPPLSQEFLNFLIHEFSDKIIINEPRGIHIAGSKEFLINFSELSAPLQICRDMESIISFKKRFPIVLKPFRDYGGKGIVRIDGDKVWEGKQEISFDDFSKKNEGKELEYLGVKFLKNVSQGDKRIIVVNGEIIGASLRMPADGSWICNVAQGGSSQLSDVDEAERKIVETINPHLAKMGIIMYGVDTLMGDDGVRVLSEINTTSIGGVTQIAQQTGKPLVEKTVDLICKYIVKKIKMKKTC